MALQLHSSKWLTAPAPEPPSPSGPSRKQGQDMCNMLVQDPMFFFAILQQERLRPWGLKQSMKPVAGMRFLKA